MIILELTLTFLKIGAFTFGGGYGMIPLVQQEVVLHGWMSESELYRFIGICESTPGPIAVNMATFVGSTCAGLAGSACATLGVILPAFVIMLLIVALLKTFRQNRYVRAAMSGIKPVVAGMILAVGVCAALRCAFDLSSGALRVDPRQLLIGAVLLCAMYVYCRRMKRRFSPVLLILFSAACGMIVYGL